MKQRKTQLTPRKAPSQRRSQQRVEAILDATASLLDEIGPDGVNTNSIADAAGIPVSSLYQYFPNKHAVFAAVAERNMQRIGEMAKEFLVDLDPKIHWHDWLARLVDLMMSICGRIEGLGPLWHTMQAHPQIYQQTQALLLKKVAVLQDILNAYRQAHGLPPVEQAEIDLLLEVTVEGTMPIITVASKLPEDDPRRGMRRQFLINQLKGLLAPFVPD